MNRHRDHEYRLLPKLFCLLGCLGMLVPDWSAQSQAAERQSIYTWQDEAGRTHFADRPTTSRQVENLNPRKPFGHIEPIEPIEPNEPDDLPEPTPPPVTADAAPQETVINPKAPPRRAEPEGVPDYPRNCQGAKNRLAELGRFQRLKVKNAAGKMVYITQQAKQALIDEALAAIKNNCNRR